MSDWKVRFHPDFLSDLERLDTKILRIFRQKKAKIKENPLRLKHLRGGANCYREEITTNIRLIYFVEGQTIWLLTIGRHDAAYRSSVKRLQRLREHLDEIATETDTLEPR